MPSRQTFPAVNSRLFLILFLSSIAAFGPIVTDFYLPVLPEQQTDFQTSASMVQLGLTTTMWGLAVGQLLIGPISDVRGRRMPLAVSMIVFTAATLGAVLAPTIEAFVLFRFLEGLGAAGGIVMSRSVAADVYGGKDLAVFMGIMGAVQGIAPISAPMIGAVLGAFMGWRGIFWLMLGIGVVLTVISIFVFRETRRPRPDEAARSPLRDVRTLMTNPLFFAIFLQQFFSTAVLFAHISASPFLLQEHYGLSATAYGILFGVMGIAITAGATLSGRVASPAAALWWGALGVFGASVLVALVFLADASIWVFVPVLILLLFPLGLTFPASMTLALSKFRGSAGSAAALLGAVGFVGGGGIAPLTTLADPRVCVGVIFLVASIALVLVSLRIRRLAAAEAEAEAASEADEE